MSEVRRERAGNPQDPLIPTNRGNRMSPDSIAQRVNVHATNAAASCSSLNAKNITPHVLRHTAAMRPQVRGIAFDASFGVVSDRESVRDFSFGASAVPAWRYGRHAI